MEPADRARRRLFLLVAALNAAVLFLTAEQQIYDTNFYSLWEATALLAGDHPYRDFFEWGIPLQMLVSLVAQVAVGYRLIGEFAVQWLGIIIGAVVSFHLGLRASGSRGWSLAMMAFTIPLLAVTAIYQYPKLLIYPVAVWVIWRYLDAPGPRRAALLGAVGTAAFLFRHDHGAYVAAAAALAFVLARIVAPLSRNVRSGLVEAAVCGGTALALLTPWLILVQTSEGILEYGRLRYERYALGRHYRNPYPSLLAIDPVRTLTPQAPPPAKAGRIAFEWQPEVTETERERIAQEHGLRLVSGPDANGRSEYEVQNILDPKLLDLTTIVNNTSGIDAQQLSQLRLRLPAPADGMLWLQQMALLVPPLLLFGAVVGVLRSRRRGERVPVDVYRAVVAAGLLGVAEWRLFLDPTYVTVVAPLAAALSTPLFPGQPRLGLWSVMHWTVVLVVLAVTMVATCAVVQSTRLFTPWKLAADVPDTFSELLASPPIEGLAPLETVMAHDRSTWHQQEVHAMEVALRYIHDCTAPGDRVLVTGQTPFHVGYYLNRPIAGGHIFWHDGWRADPIGEAQSLQMLQRQSVPFAYSTHDPVFDDLRLYPRIHEYFRKHYVELEGSGGRVLVNTRRISTGEFGAFGFPCFR